MKGMKDRRGDMTKFPDFPKLPKFVILSRQACPVVVEGSVTSSVFPESPEQIVRGPSTARGEASLPFDSAPLRVTFCHRRFHRRAKAQDDRFKGSLARLGGHGPPLQKTGRNGISRG